MFHCSAPAGVVAKVSRFLTELPPGVSVLQGSFLAQNGKHSIQPVFMTLTATFLIYETCVGPRLIRKIHTQCMGSTSLVSWDMARSIVNRRAIVGIASQALQEFPLMATSGAIGPVLTVLLLNAIAFQTR